MSILPLTALLALAASPWPPGWFPAGPETEHAVEAGEGACGPGLRLASRRRTSAWSTAMQLLPADAYRGRRVRLSAPLATRDVSGRAGLWMRIDGPEGQAPLAYDTMEDRALGGTAACAPASVVLDVPADAVTIAAGVLLQGEGVVEAGLPGLEVVSTEVASTDQKARGLPLGPPGRRPEEQPNELDASLGRVGGTWFNALGVTGPGVELHQRNPLRWSDARGDNTVVVKGDRLQVRLRPQQGLLTVRREGEAMVISGQWGWPEPYPVTVRVSRDRLDLRWGIYERHLTREEAAQVPPDCVRFTERRGTLMSATDLLYVCGQVLEPDAPPVQTAVAFLLAGFKRTPAGSDLEPRPLFGR